MTKSMAAQVVALQNMNVSELRERWIEIFGRETRQRNKHFMVKRIARELQRDHVPKLTAEEEVKVTEYREQIRRLPPELWFPSKRKRKNQRERKANDRRTPPPGSVIRRDYQGHEITIKVLGNGFEYGGQVYRSLSAIAKEVTGTVWNGFAFFKLNKGAGNERPKSKTPETNFHE